MKQFFKSIGFKILVGIALVLVGVMIYVAATGGFSSWPANLGGSVLSPLQSAFSSVGEAIGNVFSVITDGSELQQKNEQLQQEINDLRDQMVDYDEMKHRYEELVKYLELKERHPDYKFADAKVISRDPADNYGSFVINAGTTAGIAAGDPVITAEGLVGVVSEVSLNWAKVSTILDPSVHVGAYVSRTQDTGTTGGTVRLAQENRLQLNYLERDAGATVGDFVVTAGGNSQYPKDLKIGRITEVLPSSDGLSMTALVEPFADVQHAGNVLVITDFTNG